MDDPSDNHIAILVGQVLLKRIYHESLGRLMHSITRSNRRTRKELKESFRVGIQELVAQHRKLLDLINKMDDLADARNTVKTTKTKNEE